MCGDGGQRQGRGVRHYRRRRALLAASVRGLALCEHRLVQKTVPPPPGGLGGRNAGRETGDAGGVSSEARRGDALSGGRGSAEAQE